MVTDCHAALSGMTCSDLCGIDRVCHRSSNQRALAWWKSATRGQSCGAPGDWTFDMTTFGHARIDLTSTMSGVSKRSTIAVVALEVELLRRGCNSLADAPL